MTRMLLACALLLAVPRLVGAQGQYPTREDERILPRFEQLYELPSWDAWKRSSFPARPVWYLPHGTKMRLKHDRRLLPYSTKYAIGTGPVMGNQYFHLPPSDQGRVLPSDIQYTLVRVEAVYAKATYPMHLRQLHHQMRLVLQAPSGLTLELEICPGGEVTPTVGQFAEYFEIIPPANQVLN